MTNEGGHTYPMTIRSGGKDVVLRYGKPGDKASVLAMSRALPPHDLLFLARDLTKEDVVEEWLADEATTKLLAVHGDQVLGYAAIHELPMPWSSHVAELRVLVDISMRGKGLGRVLTQEAFALALVAGKEKMIGQMTLDQKGAIAVFEGLGFRPEALLRDHVKDRNGDKHDLLVLSHEVARFAAQRAAYGVNEAFGQ